MSKTTTKKTVSASKKIGRSSVTGRFLSTSEDVVAFEKAARAYAMKHAKSRAAALRALQDMGMVTATGRLTKHYR